MSISAQASRLLRAGACAVKIQTGLWRMMMPDAYGLLNLLLIDTRGDSLGFLRLPYLIFNSVEAVCWLVISLVILWRYLRHRKSRREVYYALAFLAFGLSDVIETSGTTVLLLLFKGACLLAIAGFRPGIMALHGSRRF